VSLFDANAPTAALLLVMCVAVPLLGNCAFEADELRCIMVESQPFGRSTLHYRIHDAKKGLLTEGHADIKELRARQPWG
jgi:hypothetical protein